MVERKRTPVTYRDMMIAHFEEFDNSLVRGDVFEQGRCLGFIEALVRYCPNPDEKLPSYQVPETPNTTQFLEEDTFPGCRHILMEKNTRELFCGLCGMRLQDLAGKCSQSCQKFDPPFPGSVTAIVDKNPVCEYKSHSNKIGYIFCGKYVKGIPEEQCGKSCNEYIPVIK